MRTPAALALIACTLAFPPDGAAGGRQYRVGRANGDTMGFPVRASYDPAGLTWQVSFPSEVRRADGSTGLLSRAELAVAEPLVEAEVVTRETPGATPRRSTSFRLAGSVLPRALLRLYFRYEGLDAEDLFELDLADLARGGVAAPLPNPHGR